MEAAAIKAAAAAAKAAATKEVRASAASAASAVMLLHVLMGIAIGGLVWCTRHCVPTHTFVTLCKGGGICCCPSCVVAELV